MGKEEIVFEILAEGGGLTIKRLKDRNSVKFYYHHNEFDATEEGLDVNRKGEYDSFDEPFQLINSKYPWYCLHLTTLHEDFRLYVLTELINVLNKFNVSTDALRHSKQDLEKSLNVHLEFGNPPLRNGLQNIKVTNLMKLTEYDYQEYTEESGKQDRIRGKYEIWTDEQQYSSQYNEIIREKYDFETIGKLEISGNTIIIKNEFGQIEYAFSSDKFFVSTKPILSQTKGWFYLSK